MIDIWHIMTYDVIKQTRAREAVAARESRRDLKSCVFSKFVSGCFSRKTGEENLTKAVGLPEDQICTACFSGRYLEENELKAGA